MKCLFSSRKTPSLVLVEKRREGKQKGGDGGGERQGKSGRSYPHYLQMTWAKRRIGENGWTEMSEAGNV